MRRSETMKPVFNVYYLKKSIPDHTQHKSRAQVPMKTETTMLFPEGAVRSAAEE